MQHGKHNAGTENEMFDTYTYTIQKGIQSGPTQEVAWFIEEDMGLSIASHPGYLVDHFFFTMYRSYKCCTGLWSELYFQLAKLTSRQATNILFGEILEVLMKGQLKSTQPWTCLYCSVLIYFCDAHTLPFDTLSLLSMARPSNRCNCNCVRLLL